MIHVKIDLSARTKREKNNYDFNSLVLIIYVYYANEYTSHDRLGIKL